MFINDDVEFLTQCDKKMIKNSFYIAKDTEKKIIKNCEHKKTEIQFSTYHKMTNLWHKKIEMESDFIIWIYNDDLLRWFNIFWCEKKLSKFFIKFFLVSGPLGASLQSSTSRIMWMFPSILWHLPRNEKWENWASLKCVRCNLD